MMNRSEILTEIEHQKEEYRKHTYPSIVPDWGNRFATIAMAKLEALCGVMNIFTPRHNEIWEKRQ